MDSNHPQRNKGGVGGGPGSSSALQSRRSGHDRSTADGASRATRKMKRRQSSSEIRPSSGSDRDKPAPRCSGGRSGKSKVYFARRANTDGGDGGGEGGYSVYTELSSTERGTVPDKDPQSAGDRSREGDGSATPTNKIDGAPPPFTIDGESDDDSVSIVDVHGLNESEIAWDEERGRTGEADSISIEEDGEGFDEDFDEECLGMQLRALDECCCRCLAREHGQGRRRRRKSRTFLGLGESRLLIMAWAFLAALALAIFAFIDAYDAAESAKHHASGGVGGHDNDGSEDDFSNVTVGKLGPSLDGGNSTSGSTLDSLPFNVTHISFNSTGEGPSTGSDADNMDFSTAPTPSPSEFFFSPGDGPPAPPEDIAGTCSPKSLSKSDGYWKCGAACSKGECCFMPDWHPHYCARGSKGDACKVYESACKILTRENGNDDESESKGASKEESANAAEEKKEEEGVQPTNATESSEESDNPESTTDDGEDNR